MNTINKIIKFIRLYLTKVVYKITKRKAAHVQVSSPNYRTKSYYNGS